MRVSYAYPGASLLKIPAPATQSLRGSAGSGKQAVVAPRARRTLVWVVGPLIGLTIALKILNIGKLKEITGVLKAGKESRVYRQPVGVVGVISPWNFPLHLTMRSIGPAIACGNGVVIKPASDTPVTGGLLVAKLFEEAGLPAGVLSNKMIFAFAQPRTLASIRERFARAAALC